MNVTIEWAGRLGNNMFQAATVMAYAYKHQVTPVFLEHEHFKLAKDRMIVENFYQEPYHAYREIPFLDNVLLKGYFQSEKYFKDIKELLRKYFIKHEYSELNEYVAVHVRRGDYLEYPDKHPVPDLVMYYGEAIKIFDNKFLVFSDDKEYCNDMLPGEAFVKSWDLYPNLTDYGYLQLMASCGDFIIANSSFSWWGAWLGNKEDKKVICPSYDNWFGEGNKHLYPNDIIPEDWTQIKY